MDKSHYLNRTNDNLLDMGMEYATAHCTLAEDNWLEEVYENISHSNDTVKPRIATLTVDDTFFPLHAKEESSLEHFKLN